LNALAAALVLKFNFITQQFLLVGVQGLALFPGGRVPSLRYWYHTTV